MFGKQKNKQLEKKYKRQQLESIKEKIKSKVGFNKTDCIQVHSCSFDFKVFGLINFKEYFKIELCE